MLLRFLSPVLGVAVAIAGLSGLPTPLPSALAAPRYTSIARAKEVQVGWSQSHVVRVLGQPTSKRGNLWRWRSKNGSYYSLIFKAGKVFKLRG